jgi:hypothetical protein
VGNYSRNTYDPTKGYISVRLQQGVPLVDADWNEAADVLRNELYAVNQWLLPDGFPQGSVVLQMSGWGAGNDLMTWPGAFVLGGRLGNVLPNDVLNLGLFGIFPITVYSEQRWTNQASANHDGVAVIPPLTTPAAARTDTVYADVWEQEIGSADDANLINPVIGVETCVRLKRNVAIRVAEGASAPPAPPAGHTFVPVAQLNRAAGNAQITAAMITDLRRVYATQYGARTVMLHPDLRPFSSFQPWIIYAGNADMPSGTSSADGYMALPLPDRAGNMSITVSGTVSGVANIYVYLWQIDHSGGLQLLASPSYSASAAGNFSINAGPAASYVVDRTQYAYLMVLYGVSSASANIVVYPVQLNYTL